MKKITTLFLSLFLLSYAFSQTMHTVNAGSFYYTPSSLTIQAGDSVNFINDGGVHDVVVTSGPEILSLPVCSGPCDIGTLVFDIEGEYQYICSIGSHAALGMVAEITVNPAPAYTSIPDENFEQALIVLEIDDVLDGQVLTSSVSTVERLVISDLEISDLSGIEDFTGLNYLECHNNILSSIDLAQNTTLDTLVLSNNQLNSLNLSTNIVLKSLNCSHNQLFSLDISNSPQLEFLDCSHNQFSSLDLSNNTQLDDLDCSVNQLSALDLTYNTQLIQLEAYENQLTSMDVSLNQELIYVDFESNQLSCLNLKNGNNTNFIELWTQDNPNLTCIEVDDSVYSDTTWTDNADFYIDDNQFFSNNCSYPEGCSGTVSGPKTFVPDDNFEAYLEANNMGDGIINNDSVLTAKISSVDSLQVESYNISDLSGIEDFTALIALNCGENTITSIDVSQNTALKNLAVYGNELTSIDVSNNVNLTELDVEENQLNNLNISNNTLLTVLYCSANQLTNLDVSANIELQELVAYENQLTSMDVSLNTSLIYADFEINQLTCLNLKNGNNTNFIGLWTQANPELSCIEVDDSVYSNANWLNNDEFYLDSNHYFSNDCNYSSVCSPITTSISESKVNVQVYPNPTNGEFTIDLDSYIGAVQTELFDISGRSLIKASQQKMTLTNYPDGLYFLRVYFDNKTEEIRLIKQ
jgi:plastocyanin